MSLGIAFMLVGVGLAFTIASNAMYYRRTQDPNRSRFWLPKDLLSAREYWANRVGFALTLVGLAWAIAMRFTR